MDIFARILACSLIEVPRRLALNALLVGLAVELICVITSPVVNPICLQTAMSSTVFCTTFSKILHPASSTLEHPLVINSTLFNPSVSALIVAFTNSTYDLRLRASSVEASGVETKSTLIQLLPEYAEDMETLSEELHKLQAFMLLSEDQFKESLVGSPLLRRPFSIQHMVRLPTPNAAPLITLFDEMTSMTDGFLCRVSSHTEALSVRAGMLESRLIAVGIVLETLTMCMEEEVGWWTPLRRPSRQRNYEILLSARHSIGRSILLIAKLRDVLVGVASNSHALESFLSEVVVSTKVTKAILAATKVLWSGVERLSSPFRYNNGL
ncbi:hypothetical protein HGRIS_012233 [Hohenbuehelia grisea]|uniref:Uncharacterized protein n=1 Tax=Hohenbuehelia grisea TaxID=104357 RepID=A0ABR3IRM9_9AGAR